MRRRDFLKAMCIGGAAITTVGQAALALAKEPKKSGLVVILDDFGNGQGSVNAAKNLKNVPYTAAVLPGSKYTEPAVEVLAKSNADIILHQPMEPVRMYERKLEKTLMAEPYKSGRFNPDVYRAITQNNSPAQVRKVISNNLMDLDALIKRYNPNKGVIGLNNHQGSLVTQDEELMDVVAETTDFLQHYFNRRLTLIDSKTIGNSVLKESGKKENLKSFERDYWLDKKDTGVQPDIMLKRLYSKAKSEGKIYIVIGHAHYEGTVDALNRFNRENPYALQRFDNAIK